MQRRWLATVVVSCALPSLAVHAATLAGGTDHSLALRDDGTVWAWGANGLGQLGDGTTLPRLEPVQVTELSQIVAVAAGRGFSVALDEQGTVFTWGDGAAGQLGDGRAGGGRETPFAVESLSGITAIAAGEDFVVAKRNDGTVWAWGGNGRGQLGDGTTRARSLPVQVRSASGEGALTHVVAVAAGGAHALAARADGTVWAWGGVSGGVDSSATAGTESLFAHPVEGADGSPLSGIAAVAAALESSYALTEQGTLLAWGDNSHGQLGDGSRTRRDHPVRVRTATGAPLAGVVEVAAGHRHALAVDALGALWAWGGNADRQLGLGGGLRDADLATRVLDESGTAALSEVRTAAGGAAHSLAVLAGSPTSGWAWGSNAAGQLGDGSIAGRSLPGLVGGAGYVWSVRRPNGLPPSGTYSIEPEVAVSTPTPDSVVRYTTGTDPLDPDALDASLPAGGKIPIDESTTVKARAWADGLAPSPLLEATYTMQAAPPTFTPAPGLFDSPQVVALETSTEGATIYYTTDGSEPTENGIRYSGAIDITTRTALRARTFRPGWSPSAEARATYTFDFGKLPPPAASPPPDEYPQPVTLTLESIPGALIRYTLDGEAPEATATLFKRPFVLDRSATIQARAWHRDWQESEPVRLEYVIRAPQPDSPPENSLTCGWESAQVEAVSGASYLVKPDGTAWAWGDNTGGRLGDGTTADRLLPVQVAGLADVVAVSAAPSSGVFPATGYALALESDGTVWGWGWNAYGQLGDGTQTTRTTPVQVPGLTDIVSISAGGDHSLALEADGTVWAWGRNAYGELGDGTITMRLTPVQVQGPPMTAISAGSNPSSGYRESLGLTSDGTYWYWGGTYATPDIPEATSVVGLAAIAGLGENYGLLEPPIGVVAVGSGSGTTPVDNLNSVAAIDSESGGLALRLDGSVWTWSSNSATRVLGLPTITRTAVGGGHYLAIDDSCAVWAWGLNPDGQLGDGTTDTRNTPVQVSDADFVWRVATPAFDPPSGGTYTVVSETVELTSQTPGAVIRYTTDGSEPNASSPVYTAQIPVTVTTTIRAFAAKAGMPDSGVAFGLFTMKMPAPNVQPATGTYSAPQTITMSSSIPGATIRYTLDGSEPSASSAAYAEPLVVNATTTVKARAYFAGRLDHDYAVSRTYTISIGTLAAPVISPGTGTYISSQVATITAEPDVEIRYTLDGSTPTATSPLYTGPFAIEATATIKAAAFRTGYTTSAATSATYTIKVATPAISPGAGSYAAGTRATVTTDTPGASIHYTITGATPTTADRTVAGSPPIVLGNYTLTVMAAKAGCTNSDVVSAAFTITGSVASGEPAAAPAIAASVRNSMLLAPDGTVWAWGMNNYGQLGDGSTTQRNGPVQVSNSAGTGVLSGIVALAPGPECSLALASDGTVWAWGRNNYGQLGDNTLTQRLRPVQVLGAGGAGYLTDIIAIANTDIASIALKSDGTVWAWGDNAYGQLGQNTTTDSLTPVQVKGVGGTGFLTGIVAIAGDASSALALSSDGTLYGWGYNGGGNLGDNTQTNRLAPIVVPGMTGISAIVAATDSASFARDADGDWWSFGFNRRGQLGDGTTTMRKLPVAVTALADPVRIASDGDYATDVGHGLGLLADGTLWSWGYNGYGQLGDGTTTDRLAAIPIGGLPTVQRAAAGGYHSLALGTDGSVWAWGANPNGQIGVGNAVTPVLTPVQIFEPGFVRKVATPTTNYASGTYASNGTLSVTIATETAGASIRYTLDGSDPTSSSTLYSGAIAVTTSLTLKARAYKAGMGDSHPVERNYVMKVQTPSHSAASGTYVTSKSVTIACSTTGATIHYTTNGVDPTPSDPTIASGSSYLVTTPLTLKSRAYRSGWADSDVRTTTYQIKVATPVLSPAGGSFASPPTVTATTTTPGATIRYNTSGVPASESDPILPPGGVLVDRSLTFNARGFRTDAVASDAASATYTLALGTVASPTFAPAPGTYPLLEPITISTATPGATLRYTVDGSEPGFASAVYTGPIPLSSDLTLKARAFKADWTPSATAAASYLVSTPAVAAPTFSLAPGRYSASQFVALATTTPGAEIRYTTDGSEPTAASTLYTSTLPLTSSVTIRARAFEPGMADSAVSRADYWLTGALTAGLDVTFALETDGTVWAWGHNNYGQLGIGTTVDSNVPVQVTGLSDVVGIAAGNYFALALKRDGTVWHWGQGIGTTPVQVAGLSSVIDVSAEWAQRTALKPDGTVWIWSTALGTPTQVAGLTGVAAAASGRDHRLALKTDGATSGTVWAWGPNNDHGEIGDGTNVTRTTPVAVLTDAVSIAATEWGSGAMLADGSVRVWGRNSEGQLGDGTTTNRWAPQALSVPDTVASLVRNPQVTFLLTPRGTAWVVGNNFEGQFGNGWNQSQTSPIPAWSIDDLVLLDGDDDHTVAAREDLTVWTWGRGQYGRLGNGSTASQWLPVSASGLTLGDATWAIADTDDDGLGNFRESALGTDLLDADTNDDGIPDGIQVASGQDPLDLDMDDDGLANATERANGTDPFRADTDGDGTNDAADCFPLDPTRTTCPPPVPGDVTPPAITLDEPTNATLISSVP